MQQIAMSGMQFNIIKTGFTGIGGRLTEIIDDARDFLGFQRARGRARNTYPSPVSSRTVVRVSAAIADGATGAC